MAFYSPILIVAQSGMKIALHDSKKKYTRDLLILNLKFKIVCYNYYWLEAPCFPDLDTNRAI